MRERRWESESTLSFNAVLAVGERLAGFGLKPATPAKDIICYIEEWTVESPEDIDQLDAWGIEDVTLVHVREQWQGDFFLLAGSYHTVYQRYEEVGTYCSVSHPWRIGRPLQTHFPVAMFWLGFRHLHTFIRVRVHTTEVITPGETRADAMREQWLDDRLQSFSEAITALEVPVHAEIKNHNVVVQPQHDGAPLFCSWPDAFGPCQFEYNTADPFALLVPASRLAATFGDAPATVRAYMTGFSEAALTEFQSMAPGARYTYRCSAHCPLDDLPEVLQTIAPDGRLYATLCEFQTLQLLPEGEDASAIIGIMGSEGGFQIEARLNRAPLKEEDMSPWLETVLGVPVIYSPLPPFQ
ncbi:MAG TPA: hypothetical protein VJ692_00065 [Nitrospiraceae bacterium]|nr:hypothetical protein [Nitrospiraceae bacterium]